MTPRAGARLLLLGTVLVWGTSFVVVKSALHDASPMLFNLIRMSLATCVLVAVNWRALRTVTRAQLVSGAAAGTFLAIGYQFQTLGLVRTTAAKSAFLTGLVVVLVPLLGMVPRLGTTARQGSPWITGVGAALAFCGLTLLTTPPGTPAWQLFATIQTGDVLTVICAVAFAFHLLTLARVSPHMPSGVLATVQIGAAALLMLLTLPLEGEHRVAWTPGLLAALAVTSVLSTAAAFTIQSYAQKHLQATETAVLLTLEPVFATLSSVLLLGEQFAPRALAGAGLILGSIALVELVPGLLHATEIPS